MDYSIAPSMTSINQTEFSQLTPPMNSANLLYMLMMSITEYKIAMDLNKYGLLVVIVLGCHANLLALIVMLGLGSIPMCNYMAVLAIVDTSVLLGPCLVRWVQQTQDVDPRSQNTVLCRIIHFQSHWSFALSAWTLVAMTADRFVVISFPLRARLLSTPKRAIAIILILALVLALINCHFFFTMEVRSGLEVCVAKARYEHFLRFIWPWVDATIYSFAPFFFLIVFNMLIIKNHRQYLRINISMTGLGSTANGLSAPPHLNRRLTITLLAVTISFMALTGPRALLTIIRSDVFDIKPKPNVVDFNVLAKYTLTSSVINLLMFINHGINFFLYCMTGKKFRQQFTFTFRKIYRKCMKSRKSRIAPSETGITSIMRLNSNRSNSLTENNKNIPVVQENGV